VSLLTLQGGSFYNNSTSSSFFGVGPRIGNRLHQHPNGSIEVLPKDPAFVLGERIIRPLIDGAYSLSIRTFNIIDAILSRAVNLMPMARAAAVVGQPRPNNDCTAGRVFAKAIENQRENQNLLPPPTMIMDGQASAVQTHSRKQFKNAEEGLAYLKQELGSFDELKIFCQADESIQLIQDLKEPSGNQNEQLREAYTSLQKLADTDALKNCERRIMELLDQLNSDINHYSITALDPLPDFISSLLNNSEHGYTFADLHLQAKKINELSRKMVPIYQLTNNRRSLGKWIDIMLMSAEKVVDDTNSLIATFQTATNIFKSSTAAIFQREQKNRLRKMARQYQKTSISSVDVAIIKDLLDNSGPQNLIFHYIHSILELLPDDLRIVDGNLRDIGRAIIQSSAIQIATVPFLLTAVHYLPSRIKNVLVLCGGLLALKEIVSNYAQ